MCLDNDGTCRFQIPTEAEHSDFFIEFCAINTCKQPVGLGVLREEALKLHSEDLKA